MELCGQVPTDPPLPDALVFGKAKDEQLSHIVAEVKGIHAKLNRVLEAQGLMQASLVQCTPPPVKDKIVRIKDPMGMQTTEEAETAESRGTSLTSPCPFGAVTPINCPEVDDLGKTITPTAANGNEDSRKSVFSFGSGSSTCGKWDDRPPRETVSARDATALRTRNAFNILRSVNEDKEELYSLFERAEHVELVKQEKTQFVQKMYKLSAEGLDVILDSCIGFVICCNAVFIGFSMDASEGQMTLVTVIDVLFSTIFLIELGLKIYLNGLHGQFCGRGCVMNIFDAVLILIDLLQLTLKALIPNSGDAGLADAPSASLFRIVRLVRLVRIVRLLRGPAVQTLLTMMHGMVGGLPTLGWALLMFLTTVYVVALLFREYLGRQPHEEIKEYFDGVPRAMLTTFRCSFGDCSSASGVPIFEYVDSVYGPMASIFYCVFIFSMTVGVFNVISAIFVESTLESAATIRFKQKKERLQDDDLWASRVAFLVRKMVYYDGAEMDLEQNLSNFVAELYELDIDVDVVRSVGADPEAKKALEDLDIDPEDHEALPEILDPDQGGTIAIVELVEGLRRLRGDPKRSDIVILDLTLRSIQRLVKDIHTTICPENEDSLKSRAIVRKTIVK
eukprot:TRINITY_DN14264_c1_g1_i1.p1 TRINITY_DN14264_c1_g1~~TRINITY_DN14264_c1_g1_i1.p1  ORF type:complete len:619 (+),score=108.89 TRINITY_DN14264_c1_g1_i1:153-2009(+)